MPTTGIVNPGLAERRVEQSVLAGCAALTMTTPTAPAASALAAFCPKEQVPALHEATWPTTASVKSPASHPLC